MIENQTESLTFTGSRFSLLSQVVGRMVQFDSCISSQQFRVWLFIRHVDPVKQIQRQAIKNLHFWTLTIVHYQFQATRWHCSSIWPRDIP